MEDGKLDTDELEDVYSDLQGWMVTYGPLSIAGEMSLKTIMLDLEGGMEMVSEEFGNMHTRLSNEIEELEEANSKPKSELEIKVDNLRDDLKQAKGELKKANLTIESMSKRLESLQAALKAEEERRQIDAKRYEVKITELEQDTMSAAW